MAPKRKRFFDDDVRPEDELARQRDVESLIAPRRTTPQDIPVARIEPNPFQARTTFAGLEELADAIRTQGFTSRLRVRVHPTRAGFFQLVYGERRLRAARLAGLELVPCDVASHSDDDLIEIGLAENIQRRDLDPLEEAQAFQSFIAERNYSVRRLAERIGKDKSYIEDRLKLLQIPADVQQMVVARPDTLRAAREIAKLPTPEQRAPLIADVLAGQRSTEDVRTLVRTSAEATSATRAPASSGETRNPAHQVHIEATKVQAILARWQTLVETGDGERALIAERTEGVLRTLNQIVQLLEQQADP